MNDLLYATIFILWIVINGALLLYGARHTPTDESPRHPATLAMYFGAICLTAIWALSVLGVFGVIATIALHPTYYLQNFNIMSDFVLFAAGFVSSSLLLWQARLIRREDFAGRRADEHTTFHRKEE